MQNVFLLLSVVIGSLVWAQPDDGVQKTSDSREDTSNKVKEYEPITLQSAIEQSFRLNYSEQERKFEREILQLRWQDTKESFWIPQLSTSLTVAEHKIARLKEGSLTNNATPPTPTGTLSLNLGDYTLFNWGKDYLKFLNDKSTFIRNLEILEEHRKKLRHQVIQKYFELITANEQRKSRQTQLKHVSFIYRFNRERVALKKISSQDYYQSRTEFLRTQDLSHKAVAEYKRINDDLVNLLGGPPDTDYYVKESLLFKKLQFSLDEILGMAKEGNADILTAKVNEQNSRRNFKIEQKKNLPLPKISVNLGAYHYRFANGENSARYLTRPNNSHIDVVAKVYATWSLTGKGGLLNARNVHQKRIGKALAYKQLEHAGHYAQIQAKQLFFQIKNYERNVEVLELRLVNAEKYFDAALENYLSGKTPFVNFLHALREKGDAVNALAKAKWYHLKDKVDLVTLLGREDFPGENFNSLASSSP